MDQGVVDLLALSTKDNSAEIIIGDGAEDKVAYSSGSSCPEVDGKCDAVVYSTPSDNHLNLDFASPICYASQLPVGDSALVCDNKSGLNITELEDEIPCMPAMHDCLLPMTTHPFPEVQERLEERMPCETNKRLVAVSTSLTSSQDQNSNTNETLALEAMGSKEVTPCVPTVGYIQHGSTQIPIQPSLESQRPLYSEMVPFEDNHNLDFTSSTPNPSSSLVEDGTITSDEMPASNPVGSEEMMSCVSTTHDCMHPTEPCPDVQRSRDMETTSCEDNQTSDLAFSTPHTSPLSTQDQSSDFGTASFSNATGSKEADFPQSPSYGSKADITHPFVSPPLLQANMGEIGSQLTGDEDDNQPSDAYTPSNLPIQVNQTPEHPNVPGSLYSMPLLLDSESTCTIPSMVGSEETPLAEQENFPVLTQNDAFADCTLSDAAMGENPKDIIPAHELSTDPCSTLAMSTIALNSHASPPAISPQEAEHTPDLPSSSKRLRSQNLDPTSFDTPIKPSKRAKNSKPPTPSRSSISYKIKHTKLSLPFRSPLFPKTIQSPNTVAQPATEMETDPADDDGSKASTPTLCRIKDPTITPRHQQVSRLSTVVSPAFRKRESSSQNSKAASRPFKSPFKSPLSSLSSSTTKCVSSPNIQALERRLQLLKRAIKIKADGEEKKLEELITKWRSVGRKVSWEVWSVVREQGQESSWGTESSEQRSGLGGLGRSWGWDNTAGHEQETSFESNWGYATVDGDEKDLVGSPSEASPDITMGRCDLDLNSKGEDSCGQDETHQENTSAHTLGTMLRSFGIEDEVLGWDDETEDFSMLC